MLTTAQPIMDCVLLRGLPYSKPFLSCVSVLAVLSMAPKHISSAQNKFVPIKYRWHSVLFTLYSQPLSDIISCHSCDYHKYVDDTEISDSAPPSDFTSVQSNIQSCISDILSWMQSNKLKLNMEKTEMMLVGSSVRISLVSFESADIGRNSLPF